MPGYSVRHQRVSVTSGADLEVRSLLDCQQYSDPEGLAEAAGISPATWPLFGQVWPSSRKLADIMQTHVLDGLRILEIGCGLALASLVIQRRNGNITASDCHPLTQSFLDENARLNDLPNLKYQTGNWGRDNPLLGEFDLIIGSDVLYERAMPALVAGFIQTHAAPNAEVIIIDPNRGNRSSFHKRMKALGFVMSEVLLDTPFDDGSPYRGRAFTYLRGCAA